MVRYLCQLAFGASEPTPEDVAQLPKEVNGMPAFYRWRQSAKVGRLRHPVDKWTLDVTAARIDGWVAAFQKMQANGVPVPVYEGHNPEELPDRTLGYVMAMRRKGDWYEELHQYIGQASLEVAMKNFVSLGLQDRLIDGAGNNYGEAVFHSAIVPRPLQSGQGRIAASMLGAIPMEITLNESQVNEIKALLGVPDGATADEFVKAMNDAVTKLKAEMSEMEAEMGKYKAAAADPKAEAVDPMKQMTASLNSDTLTITRELEETKIDGLVSGGHITPACAAKLKTALLGSKEKPNTTMLASVFSPTGNRLSAEIIEALKTNVTVKLASAGPAVETAKVDDDAEIKARIARVTRR